jgi:hypothetical protein
MAGAAFQPVANQARPAQDSARTVPAPSPSRPGNQARLRRLQARLTIGAVDDPLEHEADRIADHVMRMPAVTSAPLRVSRTCDACKPEEEKLQPKATNPARASGAAPASVAAALQAPGQPLAPKLRDFFEPRFGADFSAVRVHHDAQAGRSAQEIGATAYATGQNLVFAPGAYAPESQTGRQLIAHELTHVLQQNAGGAAKVQRDATDPAAAGAPAPSASGVLDLAPGEDLSAKNPKLVAFAADFQRKLAASPKAQVIASALWSSKAAFDPGGSPTDVLRAPAAARAGQVKSALVALGIPDAAIFSAPVDLNEGTAQGSDGAVRMVVLEKPFVLPASLPIMPSAMAGAPALAPADPQIAPKPSAAASGSPFDFSKFTTIQIQTPKFSFAMKVPSSIELKSMFVEGKISSTPGLALKFKPVPGSPGVEIGLSGEITSLSNLISSSPPAPGAPKASPPLKFSLSVAFNGQGFKIEASTEANLDNTQSALDNTPSAADGTPSADHRGKITSGIYLTLVEPQIKYQIPSSVVDDINSNGAKLQQAINSLMGTPNPPQASQPVGGAPAAVPGPQSTTTSVMAIATAIAGIADAMDKIDKAKTQKIAPKLSIGAGIVTPIGPPGPGGTTSNQPIPFIGIKGTF